MNEQTPLPSAWRGYQRAEVDRRLGDLSRAVAERDGQLQALRAAARTVEEQAPVARSIGVPDFTELGERIGQMLTLAAQEAETIRDQARADAAATLADAQAQAGARLEDADREAAARRQEAAAVFERQAARAAAAAAELEATLAARREQADGDHQALLDKQQRALAAVQERADSLTSDASRALGEAKAEATTLLEKARAEARGVLTAARDQAERIKRDSERELAAAIERRDAITAQLGNVRQMLGTLGGGAAIGALLDGAPEQVQANEPAVAEPVSEPGSESVSEPISQPVDESAAESAGESVQQPTVLDGALEPSQGSHISELFDELPGAHESAPRPRARTTARRR